MDFILGIFTGIAFCLFYGNYLNNQRKKKEEDAKATSEVNAWFRANHPRFEPPPYIAEVILQQKLEAAIARDDFEEAARLRDLINKK